jgi:hypothetical protein
MHWIFCYNSLILNLNPKIQAERGLIIYNTTNGITTLKNCNCGLILFFIKVEKEVNNYLTKNEREPF